MQKSKIHVGDYVAGKPRCGLGPNMYNKIYRVGKVIFVSEIADFIVTQLPDFSLAFHCCDVLSLKDALEAGVINRKMVEEVYAICEEVKT